MTIRQHRLLLRMTAGILLLGAGGVGVWAWQTRPIDIAVTEEDRPTEDAAPVATVSGQRSLDEFVGLWSRELRRPLFDPPPRPPPRPEPKPVVRQAAKPVAPPAPPKPDVELVGTILEAGRSVALISDPSGKIDLKGVGQTLELKPAGIRIEDIEAETVTVSYQGHQSTLKLDKRRRSNAPDKPARRRRRNQ